VARKVGPPLEKIHPDDRADAVLTADNHIWLRVPKCRGEDEYIPAMFKKLDFICNLQKAHGNIPVLSAGDVTGEWYVNKGDQWFLTEIIKRMDNWIAVPGQHDLPQHSLELYPKSLLATLEEAGCIEVMKEPWQQTLEGINIAGIPWGVDISKGWDAYPTDNPKILLIHRMTYLTHAPPYPGVEKSGGGTAVALMKKMEGFDLIVTGDNHETFLIDESGHALMFQDAPEGRKHSSKKLLVNPGSMMRTTTTQEDHEPCVFLWWAKTNTIERVILPHEKGVISRERQMFTRTQG
jgi:hypothetical protein